MTLPHDAMIGLERFAQNGSGSGYFPGGVFTTFDGRALGIIRPTGESGITVTVSAKGCDDVTIQIDAHVVTAEAQRGTQ